MAFANDKINTQHFLSSQSETTLTQKYVLTELVKEVLATDTTNFGDVETAGKLLAVIARGALVAILEEKEEYDSLLLSNSFRVMTKTIDMNPLVLTVNLSQTSIPAYRYLADRSLPFLVSSDQNVCQECCLALTSIWTSLMSEPSCWLSISDLQDLWLQYLDNISHLFESSQGLDHKLQFPSSVISRKDSFPYKYTPIQLLQLAVSLSFIYTNAADGVAHQLVVTQRDGQRMINLLSLVKPFLSFQKSHPSYVTYLHALFIRTCTKGISAYAELAYEWINLGSNWLQSICNGDIAPDPGSDFDNSIADFIMTVAVSIYSFKELPDATPVYPVTLFAKLEWQKWNENSNAYSSMKYLYVAGGGPTLHDIDSSLATDEKRKYIADLSLVTRASSAIFPGMPAGSNISDYILGSFEDISQQEKIDRIRRLGYSACNMAHHLETQDRPPTRYDTKCHICNSDDPIIISDRPKMKELNFEAIFSKIIRSQKFQQNLDLRLETIASLKKVLFAFQPRSEFSVESSTDIVAWIVACLKSTSRELRVSAGRILPCFLCEDSEKFQKNLSEMFKLLSSFNFEIDTYLVETTVMAWAQVGKICNGEQLNFVLMYLIRILGSESSFRASTTYCELQLLARSKSKTCWQLCAPFWSTISVMVVKEVHTRPQLLVRFSQLLEVSQDDFLERTVSFTLPYLVLAKNFDIIEKIAEACDSNTRKLCLDYFPSIMAVLLIQDVEDPVSFSQQRWYSIDSVFNEVSFSEVLFPNILKLAYELLKLNQLAPPDEKKKQRIINSLAYASSIRHNQKNASTQAVLLLFNESFVLQLIALFSETIRNLRGRSSDSTKLQCLSGISCMLEISGDNFVNAVPQVCTLLQSALEVEELQEYSMRVWSVMINCLGGPKWANITNLTFSVVLQKWYDLVPSAKDVARDMITNMVAQNTNTIESQILQHGLPSFKAIPSFSYVQQILDLASPKKDSFAKLRDLLVRSDDENVYIVRQTMEELRSFLLEEQKSIEEGMNNKDHLGLIRDLMRTLLSREYEFRNSELDISLLCSQCIGLVGAVDHHLVDIGTKDEGLIVVNNFNGARESIEFVMVILHKFLVRTFRASTDPSLQMFLAYGIQEFLKFCGYTTQSIHQGATAEYWNKFSYEDRSTLYTLLSTRYSAPPALPSTTDYPVFNEESTYSVWLQIFTYDLMTRVTGANATKLFGLCRRVVRDKKQYQSMFSFVLPYVALNVVIGGTDEERQNILNEILLILNASTGDILDIALFHQSVFSLVDYFSKWTRSRKKYNLNLFQHTNKHRQSNSTAKQQDKEISIVEDLLSKISPDLLASRSFDCKSYPRAIMYWEELYRQELENSPRSLKPNQKIEDKFQNNLLKKFENIYFELDDPDAHAGILAMFPVTTIDMELRQFENTGRWGQALECYNALMSKNKSWDLPTQSKAMKCLKEDGRYDDLLTRLDTANQSQIPKDWVDMGIEVSWLTGKWDSLEQWLSRASNESYEVGVGYALLALKERNQTELEYWITNARSHLSNAISAISATSLAPFSDSLVRLHALADLESIGDLVFGQQDSAVHSVISTVLDNRMKVCGNNYATRRYLLALRRSAMSISTLSFGKQEVGLSWIASARDARKQGQYALAFQGCLQAMVMGNLDVASHYQYAKLLWDQGDQRRAIQTIEPYLDSKFVRTGQFALGRKIEREESLISLKYTSWLDTAGQLDSDSIIARYKSICRVAADWENAYYFLAKYYNKLEDTQNSLPYTMRNVECLDGLYVKLMVTNYARSLQVGNRFILESLPKLITTWLNFAQVWERPAGAPAKGPALNAPRRMEVIVHINNFLNKMVGKIPAYVFYMALPQLLSRITVDSPDVYDVVQNIVVETARVYPQQSLWPILGVFYSRKKERKERGEAIIGHLKKKFTSRKQQELLAAATKFAAEMILLCNFPPPERRLTVNLSDLEFDKRVFPCSLVLPIASQMVAALPTETEDIAKHASFPVEPATIVEIEEEVIIQSSLQKPKRINILASNGLTYKILCKPKDDVRKDARLMEFTHSVDKLLTQNSEAYHRHLKINTYHVTPLNEDCGLIEWVDGAMPLRSIVNRNYSTKGIQINWMEIKGKLSTASEGELLANYKELLLTYKPVLYEWFIDTFPEPANWLASRIRYARTCAVMSMVGYILGLGDRHGENVLFLEATGELLHVDFDCLFDKGLSFEKPERVPFRLTHHMVDAMGITGYEGWFRRSSEVTLSLLRNNEDMLMNILEAFLHDPIVDWAKKKKHNNHKLINGLSPARSPEEALSSIKRKIQGIKGSDPVALSVSGQVEYLIQQATSDVNLSQMYIGWAPFL